MKHGDFTELAAEYVNRTGYSLTALNVISGHIKRTLGKEKLTLADVGAGTGKLTENLIQLGFSGYTVEPNDAMRTEGIKYLKQYGEKFKWSAGTAEVTNLPDNSVDWVTMGSSFHWADTQQALEDFARILRPGGFFTAIFNPRDLERSEFHLGLEGKIHDMVPNMKRVSSASAKHMMDVDKKLLSTDLFGDLFFVEAPHEELMTRDRYLGAWRSVNDIRVQAGEELFADIMKMIEAETADMPEIVVPYLSRAWTVRLNNS